MRSCGYQSSGHPSLGSGLAEPNCRGEVSNIGSSREQSPAPRRADGSEGQSDGQYHSPLHGPLRPHPRGSRAQSLGGLARDSSQRARGFHPRLWIRKVVPGLRNAVRGSPAALPQVRLAACPAAFPPNDGAEVDAIEGCRPPSRLKVTVLPKATASVDVGSVMT